LPPHVFADLTEVCIDDFDSLETVFALVERSPRVEFIELRTQLLKGADLARLCRLSSLRGLKIQQGALTPDDLCQLARLQRFKWLEVYAATLTRSEALRIREALRQNNADTVMDAWRGNDKSEYSILDARYAHIGE
jgi:hypothetical protein